MENKLQLTCAGLLDRPEPGRLPALPAGGGGGRAAEAAGGGEVGGEAAGEVTGVTVLARHRHQHLGTSSLQRELHTTPSFRF